MPTYEVESLADMLTLWTTTIPTGQEVRCLVQGYYAGLPALGGGIFAYRSSMSLTPDGGTIFENTGSGHPTDRFWIRVRQAVLTVRDFGARGNGSTDDTDAFERAIRTVGNAGTLRVPGGTYRTTQLAIQDSGGGALSGFTMQLDHGATIQRTGTTDEPLILIPGSNVTIQGGAFNCNGAGVGIYATNSGPILNDITIRDVSISNTGVDRAGIHLRKVERSRVMFNRLTDTRGWGILIETGAPARVDPVELENLQILHNRVRRSTTVLPASRNNGGIALRSTAAGKAFRFVSMIGNMVDLPEVTTTGGASQVCMEVDATNDAGITTLGETRDMTIVANVTRGGTAAVRLRRTGNISVAGNTSTGATSRAIEAQGADNIALGANVVHAGSSALARAVSVTRLAYAGVSVDSESVAVGSNSIFGPVSDGIRFENTIRPVANGNAIRLGGTGEPTNRFGITFKDVSGGGCVVGNAIEGQPFGTSQKGNSGVNLDLATDMPISVSGNVIRNMVDSAIRFATGEFSNTALVGNAIQVSPQIWNLSSASFSTSGDVRIEGNSRLSATYSFDVLNAGTNVRIWTGAVDPTTTAFASGLGSVLLRPSGVANQTLYVKTSSGGTGWTAK